MSVACNDAGIEMGPDSCLPGPSHTSPLLLHYQPIYYLLALLTQVYFHCKL